MVPAPHEPPGPHELQIGAIANQGDLWTRKKFDTVGVTLPAHIDIDRLRMLSGIRAMPTNKPKQRQEQLQMPLHASSRTSPGSLHPRIPVVERTTAFLEASKSAGTKATIAQGGKAPHNDAMTKAAKNTGCAGKKILPEQISGKP
jgi:hypothetical protein